MRARTANIRRKRKLPRAMRNAHISESPRRISQRKLTRPALRTQNSSTSASRAMSNRAPHA
eukprot:2727513-Alexandrium_andersonii.AAC.1